MTDRGAAFVLDRVVKRYGTATVLDGVSLTVQPGEFVAILGPNGAGKTTSVEILEGYRTPDAGVVRVLGQDPARGGPALKARVGLMLQGGGLDPRSAPRALLHLYASFHDGARSADALLDTVGLGSVANTTVRRLSGGERQRLALALALVGDPEVLILDEPTAGMDPDARRATRELIAGLHAEGRTILITTHDLGDVERLADRVVVLHRGGIVADDSPAALVAGAAPRLRFRLARALTEPELAALEAAIGAVSPAARLIREPGAAPDALLVEGVIPDPILVATVAAWCAFAAVQLIELRSAAATLEERYLELTGDRAVEVGS